VSEKTGLPFFPARNTGELDAVQLVLANWILFYRSVFELPPHEAPGDDVIEDDERMDAWYRNYQRERTKEGARAANPDSPAAQEHTLGHMGKASGTL